MKTTAAICSQQLLANAPDSYSYIRRGPSIQFTFACALLAMTRGATRSVGCRGCAMRLRGGARVSKGSGQTYHSGAIEGKAIAIGALAPALGDNVKLAKQMSQHSDNEKVVIKQDRIKKHEQRKAVDPSIVKAAKSTRTGTRTFRAQHAKRSEKDTDEEDSRLGTRDEYEKDSGICEDDSLSQLSVESEDRILDDTASAQFSDEEEEEVVEEENVEEEEEEEST